MGIRSYLLRYGFKRQSKASQFYDIVCDGTRFTYRYIDKYRYKLSEWDTGDCYETWNLESFTLDNLFAITYNHDEFYKFNVYINVKRRSFIIDDILLDL